jgi:RNA polymerase sigma factor (sigma-70 family)
MSEATFPLGARGRIEVTRLLSDERLARRAVKGDERAFAAIFDRYHQDLYRYCLAIVGNSADAQDALQNTMVKVLRALPGEERRIELKPWLYRIAHNESVELLRRRRPAEQLDPDLTAVRGGLAEDAEARERLRRLIADLELLPDRQRGALVMRELGGLDFEQIGTALGTSSATARQTLYEARQSLRQMDEGREMDCAAVTRALSDADGRVTRRRDIRAHLRACPDCRRFSEEIEGRREDLRALAPLPGVVAAGLLQGLLGGAAVSGGAGAGAGLAGAAAGGTAKSLGAGAAVKSAAAVAAIAAVGVGAADRTGVVDVGPWGGDGRQAQRESGGEGNSGSAPPHAASPGSDPLDPAAAGGKRGSSTAKSAPALDPGEGAEKGAGQKAGGAAPAAPAAASEDAPSVAAPDSGGSHPRGRGHEKQHPEAASHGQQTAAGHKADGKGTGKGQGQGNGGGKDPSAKQPKPSKPVKPSQPEPKGEGKATASPKAPADPGAATPPYPSPSPQGEAKGNPHIPGREPPLAE